MICNTYVQFFKTISDPSRVEVLFHLKDKDHYVGELVDKMGKEQSSVSHNLRILKERGFVHSVPNGKQRKYTLTPEGKGMMKTMDKHIKRHFHKDCRCGKK